MTDKVPVIELMQSGLLITSLKLEGGAQWLIGRSLDCNLTINHPTLSRKHARVHLEDGAYYLTDLGSTHGTRIAGKPLQPQQPTRLFDGLKITLGDHKGELLPANMMTAVLAAMRAAQEEQAAQQRRRQELEDADDDVSADPMAAGSETAPPLEEEEMRSLFPATFGSRQEAKGASLETTHAANARGATLKLTAAAKGKKKTIQVHYTPRAAAAAAPATLFSPPVPRITPLHPPLSNADRRQRWRQPTRRAFRRGGGAQSDRGAPSRHHHRRVCIRVQRRCGRRRRRLRGSAKASRRRHRRREQKGRRRR